MIDVSQVFESILKVIAISVDKSPGLCSLMLLFFQKVHVKEDDDDDEEDEETESEEEEEEDNKVNTKWRCAINMFAYISLVHKY